MDDDRLRLIFTCCHPALATNVQVALTLRLLGGLAPRRKSPMHSCCRKPPWPSVCVRAKAKIPGRQDSVPGAAGRGTACPPAAGAGGGVPDLQRGLQFQLRWPADRGRTSAGKRSGWADLLAALMPDEPEATGLLALMLLTESRRPARVSQRPARPGASWRPRTARLSGPFVPCITGGGRSCWTQCAPPAAPRPAVPAPGRDQRRPQRRVRRRSNGLAADSPAL